MKIIEGFKLRKIGNEYIIAGEGLGQVDFNKIISLNNTAAWLWEQVEDKDFNAGTLANLIISHYDIDEETARKDAEDLLNEWVRVKIVE